MIARLSPGNAIPSMLAPRFEEIKLASCQLELPPQKGSETNQLELEKSLTRVSKPKNDTYNQERIDKLFSKLDLSGCDSWSKKQKQMVQECIIKHNRVFAVDDLELGKTDLVRHEIKLDNYVPFKERYRRIPPHQYEEVRKHLNEMLEIGAIRKSNSPWASAVVLVRKKDGSLRFCIDLRKLNARTVKDAYSLPRIEDSLDSLNGSCIFTSIDLKAGYWQVEMDPQSIPLTAFTVGPLGFYECVKMPFGLTNAPATFQRLMETCLGDLHLNWCIIYLDDVVIFLSDTEYLVFLGSSSRVSMSFLRLIVSILVLSSIQWSPAHLSLAKSFLSITGLVLFWHTKKVCLKICSPMFISQLILHLAPKLVPSAQTTFRSLVVFIGPSFSLLYISPDITLLVAPVSKSEFILVFLMEVGKTVPLADPAKPMSVEAAISHSSSLSGTAVK